MRSSIFLAISALVVLGSSPSFAANSTVGRITYIYPDGRHLILDSSREYKLGASVDAHSVSVAQFVQLTLGSKNEVIKISPGPADLAESWPAHGGP